MKTIPWRLAAVACFSLFVLNGPVPSPANAEVQELEEVFRFDSEDHTQVGYATDLVGEYAIYSNRGPRTVDIAHQRGSDPRSWTTSTVTAPTSDDRFGSAVALNDSADRAYVSSSTDKAIVVYARTGVNDWAYEKTLYAPELPERVNDLRKTFGEALSYDGDRLLIGAPNAKVDGKSNAGFAFLLDLRTESWTPLIPETPVAESITGQSVALQGDYAAISAVQTRNEAKQQVGGVYLWDLAAQDEPRFVSQPMDDSRVCLPTNGGGEGFGMSLAFDAETLFVGSPVEINYTADDPSDPVGGCSASAIHTGTTTQGAVYRFTLGLEQIGSKILPPAGSVSYGYSIAVSENALLAHAQHAPDFAGEVIVTDISTLETAASVEEHHRQRPTPAQTLIASNPSAYAAFGKQLYGNALTVDGPRALVAAPDAQNRTGAVYVFHPISPNVAPVDLTATNLTLEYGQRGSIRVSVTNAISEGTLTGALAGTALDEVDTVDGEAEIPLPPELLDVGEYPITLAFTPTGASAPVASTDDPRLTVTPAATRVSLRTAPDQNSDAIGVSGTVVAAHGTRPGGSVSVLLGGAEIAEITLDQDGGFALAEELTVSADALLEARYPGDGNHLDSSASEELLGSDHDDQEKPQPTPTTTPPATTGPPPTSPPPGPELRTPLADTGAGLPWIIAAAAVLLTVGGWLRRRATRA